MNKRSCWNRSAHLEFSWQSWTCNSCICNTEAALKWMCKYYLHLLHWSTEFPVLQLKPSRRQHSPFDLSCYLLILLPFHNLLLSLSSIHCYSLYGYAPCGKQETWWWLNKSTQDGNKLTDDLREITFSFVSNTVTQRYDSTSRYKNVCEHTVIWNANSVMGDDVWTYCHLSSLPPTFNCNSFKCHRTAASPSAGIGVPLRFHLQVAV